MGDRLGIENPLYLNSSTALSRVKGTQFGAPEGYDFGSPEQNIPAPQVSEQAYGLTRPGRTSKSAPEVMYGAPSGYKFEEPAPAPEPVVSAPPADENNFTRNFKKALYQAKQTGYGAAALIGDTVGNEAIKTFGLEGYKDVEKDVQKYSAANDSFTYAISKDGSIAQWMTGAAGYLSGQVLESGAAALAGAAIGSALPGAGTLGGAVVGTIQKEAVKAGIRGKIASMVEKQYASKLAAGMTEEAAAKAIGASLMGTIGANAGNFLFNATQELGSIYGEAIQESAKTGQEYSLGKIWLTGIGAAALDSVADTMAFRGLSKSIGGEREARSFLGEAFRAGAREGVTETAQTALGRYGANKDLTSHEALVEYVDSAALGAFGGGLIGGGTRLVARSAEKPGEGTPVPPGTSSNTETGSTTGTTSTSGLNPADGQQESVEAPAISFGEIRQTLLSPNGGSFAAALYEQSSPEDQKMISMAVDRAGTTARTEFNDALNNEELLANGRDLVSQYGDFAERFMTGLPGFATTQSKPGEYQRAPGSVGRAASFDRDVADENYWNSLADSATQEDNADVSTDVSTTGNTAQKPPAKQSAPARIAELEELGNRTGLTKEQYSELENLRLQENELALQEQQNNDRFRFSKVRKPTQPGMPTVVTGEAAQTFSPPWTQTKQQEAPAPITLPELPSMDGSVRLTGASPALATDQLKADKATKFIGRGSEQSNTATYAANFSGLANTGSYVPNDVVFVSAENDRQGRIEPDFAEIQKALDAKAVVITDDAQARSRTDNIGERQVAEYLSLNGYNDGGTGVWKPVAAPTVASKNTAPVAPIDTTAVDKLNAIRAENAARPAAPAVVTQPKQEKWELPFPPPPAEPTARDLKQRVSTIIDRFVNPEDRSRTFLSKGDAERLMGLIPNGVLTKQKIDLFESQLSKVEANAQQNVKNFKLGKEDADPRVIASLRKTNELLTKTRLKFNVKPRFTQATQVQGKPLAAPINVSNVLNAQRPTKSMAALAQQELLLDREHLLQELAKLKKPNVMRQISERTGRSQEMLEKPGVEGIPAEEIAASNPPAPEVKKTRERGDSVEINNFESAYLHSKPFKQLVDLMALAIKRGVAQPAKDLRGYPQAVRDLNNSFDPKDRDAVGKYLVKFTKPENLKQVSEKLVDTTNRNSNLSEAAQKLVNKFRAKVESIMLAKDTDDSFKDAINRIRDRIKDAQEVAKKKTRKEGEPTYLYASFHEKDLRTYGESYFVDRDFDESDVATSKVASLNQLIIDLQNKKDEARAKLIEENYFSFKDELAAARQDALAEGAPVKEIDEIFNAADKSLDAMLKANEAPPIEAIAQIAMEDGPAVADTKTTKAEDIVQAYIDGLKDRRSGADAADVALEASIAMRSGEVTYEQIDRAFRKAGLTPPFDLMSHLTHPSVSTRLSDWVAKYGNQYVIRHAWFNNLYLRKKDQGSVRNILRSVALTPEEEAEFEVWLEARVRFKQSARKPNNESILDIDSFSDSLFSRFRLDQLRNPDRILNEKTRTFITTLFPDPVDAWFNDLHHAITTAPDLKSAITDPQNGLVTPADWVAYENWNKQRLAAKLKAAEINSRKSYAQDLANLKGLTDTDFDKYKLELAIADINEQEAVINSAAQLNDYIIRAETESNNQGYSEQVSDEFLDEVSTRDELDATSVDSIDVLIDGEFDEGKTDTVTDIDLNDDGEVVHRSVDDTDSPAWDRARLARGRYTGVLSNSIVQTIVKRITASWPNAPHIVVLQNAGQLPDGIREQVIGKLDEADVSAKGLFDSKTGTTYLFSDFLAGEADVQFVLFHEVQGHFGLRAFLGNSLDQTLDLVYRTNPSLKEAVDRRIEATGEPKLEAIEEVLADMQGRGLDVGMFKQIVGKLVTALRKFGFNSVADWIAKSSDAEIATLLLNAKKAARGEITPHKGAPDAIRLATAKIPYELFSMKARTTTAYARYNPIADEWFVFAGQNGADVKTGNYTSLVIKDYEDVVEYLRKMGKVERRLRSGMFVDNKLGEDLVTLPKVDDVKGVKRKLREIQMFVQNEYLPVFELVDALAAQGGINDNNNVKKALLLYERTTGAMLDRFNRRHVKPIMDLVDQAKKAGADKDFINSYMVARHAEERNKQVNRTNPAILYGSGMSPNGEQGKVSYKKILQEARTRNLDTVLEKIGAITDRLGDAKVDMEVAYGLISAKEGKARKAAYRNYVNMSGVNSAMFPDDEVDMSGPGRLFNVRSQDKRAFGRGDVAPDVIARTLVAYENSIIRAQKNAVAQKVLNLMETHYDPGFVVINEQSIKPKYDKDNKTTTYVLDENYIQRPDVMVARVRGIPTTMRFKQTGKATFADAIHGHVAPRESGAISELLGKYNKLLGQMLTSWNPAWVMVNFIRDVQTLFFNAAVDKKVSKAMAFKMVKDTRKCAAAAMHIALEQYEPKNAPGKAAKATLQKLLGKPDPAMRVLYEEASKAGALTSFLNRKDLDSQIEQIGIALGGKDPWAKLRAVADFIELMTIPTEMAPRLAAYKVMKEHGYSKSDAAVFAGGITVNFNMRGTGKELRQWYLFFNPAIQGTTQMFTLAKQNPKVFASVAGGWVAFGMMMAFFGRAMSGDDEDGINKLDKVPLFKRTTSVVLSANVPGAAIPIPYGWNAFYSIGNFAMDTVMGAQNLSTSAARALKATFEAFSPVGGSALDSKQGMAYQIFKTLMPTAANGAVEWWMNENRYGAPIRKTSIQGRASDPLPYMAFDSTSPISKMIAQGLHSATGGSRWSHEGIQFNPAVIDHFLGAYAPGVVAESYKAASVAVRVAKGEEVRNSPLPLVDRFTAKVPDGWNAGAFRRAQELVDNKWREFENEPDRTRIDKWRQEYAGLGQAKQIIGSVSAEIRKLEALNNKLEASDRPQAEKAEFRNRVKERERDLYAKAVKAVMNVGNGGNQPFREAMLNAE
jgi:hypothetical protein